MNRWGKWAFVVSAAVSGVALVLANRVVISQQPTTLLSPNASAAQRIVDLFEKARPHLEEALGAKLDFEPQFRAVTAGELLATPDEDLDGHVNWHFPHLEAQTLIRTRQIARQIVDKSTVAHYDERAKVIVVDLENLPKIAAWDEELASVNSDAFLQLDLVREAVRWHLDQRYHLASLRRGCHDAEEFDALEAVIEGRTTAVTRQVAIKIGSGAAFPPLATRYLHVPDDAPDAALKTISQTALRSRYRAAEQGMAFFNGLAASGVRDVETLVLTRLPRQMTVITQPQRWVDALNKKQPDLAAVLGPLETAMPSAQWQPQQQTWTPAMLAQVASLLGAPRERAEKVGSSWYEGRSLIWTKRDQPDCQVALTVVRHIDNAGARAHFGFAVDLERKQDVLPAESCGPTLRVIESKSTTVTIVGFDEAIRNDKRISFGGAAPISVSQVLARVGDIVVECTWHGQTADVALADRLFQSVNTAAK
jgi:hypothetical protein